MTNPAKNFFMLSEEEQKKVWSKINQEANRMQAESIGWRYFRNGEEVRVESFDDFTNALGHNVNIVSFPVK